MLFADLGCCGGCCGDCCGGSYGGCWWVGILFIDLACCAGYPGAVGVRGDISALKLNGVENLWWDVGTP